MTANLPRLARSDRPRPGVGIVHLGLGAFFRAHGALYVAETMAASGGDWGIAGVSLRSAAVRDALAPQGFAYAALERGPEGDSVRVCEAIETVLVAPEDPGAALALMADPRIRIVSLTVTEKGYRHLPATGRLDLADPATRRDATEAFPVTAPGFLVRALERRRAAGLRPFTVLCCDNLPANGRVARAVTLDLARLIDPALADWIAAEGRFPSAMVDRIVPAATAADAARVAALLGRRDAAPAVHEPFRQWVIEDDFVDGDRPDLAVAGAELVADVAAHERMKLRMLNGAHSALAYLGLLAGRETVAEAVADPAFDAFLAALWREEVIPSLEAPAGLGPSAYAGALRRRFGNPAMRHRLAQIATDGSQKLPQRLLAPIADNFATGRPCLRLMLAVAAWMRHLTGADEAGRPIPVSDPLAERLRALAAGAADPAARVRALLSAAEVFDPAFAPRLAPGLTAAYEALDNLGARRAAEELG